MIGNWEREIARFAPELKTLIHHGQQRRFGAEFTAQVQAQDVIITTYSLAYRDFTILAAIDWDGIILDEAQNIKNTEAKQTKSIKKLPAGFRIALTGTPVENRLTELWSIMDFLNPGYLDQVTEFRNKFALPIERYRSKGAAERLHRLIQPFLLRRVKTDPRIIDDLLSGLGRHL